MILNSDGSEEAAGIIDDWEKKFEDEEVGDSEQSTEEDSSGLFQITESCRAVDILSTYVEDF